MLFDRRNPSSLISCIAFARENARCIRDQLSSEVWETLNTFFLKLKTTTTDVTPNLAPVLISITSNPRFSSSMESPNP